MESSCLSAPVYSKKNLMRIRSGTEPRSLPFSPRFTRDVNGRENVSEQMSGGEWHHFLLHIMNYLMCQRKRRGGSSIDRSQFVVVA